MNQPVDLQENVPALRFRTARPEDADVAVELMYSAGPQAFEYGFSSPGQSARMFLRHCFESGRGLFGCQNHTVVEARGEVLAIGSFYSDQMYPALNRMLVWQMLQFFPLSAWPRVLYRGLQLQKLLPAPGRRSLYVANLGVLPSQRGRGIGEALLRRQHAQARQQGLHTCALDVASSNPRAQALYERLGYVQQSEQRFTGPQNLVPDARRLVLPLQAE